MYFFFSYLYTFMSPYQYYLIWCYTVSKEKVGEKKKISNLTLFLLAVHFFASSDA